MIYFIHDFNHFIVMALLKILLFCAHLAAKYITFGNLIFGNSGIILTGRAGRIQLFSSRVLCRL